MRNAECGMKPVVVSYYVLEDFLSRLTIDYPLPTAHSILDPEP
jgi:hypothetical protein